MGDLLLSSLVGVDDDVAAVVVGAVVLVYINRTRYVPVGLDLAIHNNACATVSA